MERRQPMQGAIQLPNKNKDWQKGAKNNSNTGFANSPKEKTKAKERAKMQAKKKIKDD